MSSADEGQSPKFIFVEDDGKARIISSGKSKFRTGDKVYLLTSGGASREGPYVIATVPSLGVYTLSFENGQSVNGGNEVEEKNLEQA